MEVMGCWTWDVGHYVGVLLRTWDMGWDLALGIDVGRGWWGLLGGDMECET